MTRYQSAIVIGASSGIGRALASQLACHGLTVGIASRRGELLDSLAAERPGQFHVQTMDIRDIASALRGFQTLIDQLGGAVDLVIVNAGAGTENRSLNLEDDLLSIDTNARAFAALCAASFKQFSKQGRGHLVGISSIVADRPSPAIAYSASKSFAAAYLAGLRMKAIGEGREIWVTDIRPGFVDTDMIDKRKAFWIATPEKAARQIISAIYRHKRVAYVTRRWRLIAFIFRNLPERMLARLFYGAPSKQR